ncbi:hypothetical protein DAPPUDRAFT_253433 [Daphnia pulex]|uniref:Uncharacterized protein n=1 Tax=Daphnia pulex TaxID=6669 RepID=E9H4T9_DAPPU|nr:hypothetical protein DAPPUDRAFT_253433 [Daphnia pulex]|eukprot:EFX73204.1 hypothetical protein DAPPUDRAFT_253433 [Daphnia pulex]
MADDSPSLLGIRIINIDECNKSGETALHIAAKASNVTNARHLLSRGADINSRDKNGITPLLLAAKFAKEMELIDLFLDNQKVDLRYCDELGDNIIDYAEKNTYGLREKIIDCLKEIDDGVIKEYNVLKLTNCEMQHIPGWKSLIWDLQDYFYNGSSWLQPFSALIAHSPLTKNCKWKLFYVPFADLRPGKGSDISESSFIRLMANEESRQQLNSAEYEMLSIFGDIAHDSKITQVHVYQSNSHSKTNFMSTSKCYGVYKTTSEKDGERWWSVDNVNANYFILQRSRDKDAVENKFGGKERKDVRLLGSNLEGEVSIKINFAILWAISILQKKLQKFHFELPFFASMTELEHNREDIINNIKARNPVLKDLVHILTGVPSWPPSLLAVYFGNAQLFDRTFAMTNNFYAELHPLHLATVLPNQMKMVRHLMENYNADPTVRNGLGRNALEMAAMHSDDTEVLNLLLRHENVEIDGCDESGKTALHFAAHSSNVITARHLIKMGATPNLFDSNGHSPLHSAAYHCNNTEMIDLLLKAQKKIQGDDGIDNVDDRVEITALHSAAIASNEITAKHLIKRGADPRRKDKLGRTPLHYAASYAKDINIIDVLVNNKQVDVDALDYSGLRALSYAKCNQHGLTSDIGLETAGKMINKAIFIYSCFTLHAIEVQLLRRDTAHSYKS